MGQSNISTLIEDIQNLFKGKSFLEHLDSFSRGLNEEIRSRFEEYLIEKEPTLRLSMIGHPLRQIYYDLKNYKGEALPVEAQFKFLWGTILEHLAVFLIKESGHKITDIQKEVSIDGVPGHIDCIVDNVLLDVKSCSSYSYNKFKSGDLRKPEDDSFGYIWQLSAYFRALSEANYSLDGAAFLAIDKVKGNLCLLKFTKEELLSYDVRSRIAKAREDLLSDTPPERCYEPVPLSKKDPNGSLVLGVPCSYCRHKQRCWDDANQGAGLIKVSYSYGDKWFVDTKERKFRKETTIDKFPTK